MVEDLTLVAESAFDLTGTRVDRSGAVPKIIGALICGTKSNRGYPYKPNAWSDEAIKAIENRPGYVGHGKPGEPRDLKDKIVIWTNPRRREDGQPIADAEVNPKHKLAETLLWAAEHKPNFCCFSHKSHVNWEGEPHHSAVESIRETLSIDLVGEGGTTQSLFDAAKIVYESARAIYESAANPRGSTVPNPTIRQFAQKLGQRCDVSQLLKLNFLLGKVKNKKGTIVQEDMGDEEMPADAPDAMTADPKEGVSAAFKAAIMAEVDQCMEEAGDVAKVKECLGKIKKMLMAHNDIKGGGAEGETEDTTDEEPDMPTEESANNILDLISSEDFHPTATQLTALKSLPAKERVPFIREQKGLAKASRPRSGIVQENKGGANGGKKETGLEEATRIARENRDMIRGIKTA
jgi:hypothetical protein